MSKLLGVTIGELLLAEYREPTAYMGDWLTDGSLGMVHAWRGTGKTFFVLCLMLCLATATPFLGWLPRRKARVIYFDGELGKGPLKKRLVPLVDALDGDCKEDDIRVLTYEDTGGIIWDLSQPECQDWYSRHMQDYDIAMIDNLATCVKLQPGESEVEAWARIQPWLIKERGKGRCVIMVHHSGKAGTQRGTSTKEDVLDWVIQLRRPADVMPEEGCVFEVMFEKARHATGEDVATRIARLVGDKFTHELIRSVEEREIGELLMKGMKPKVIAAMLGMHPLRVMRICERINDGNQGSGQRGEGGPDDEDPNF